MFTIPDGLNHTGNGYSPKYPLLLIFITPLKVFTNKGCWAQCMSCNMLASAIMLNVDALLRMMDLDGVEEFFNFWTCEML